MHKVVDGRDRVVRQRKVAGLSVRVRLLCLRKKVELYQASPAVSIAHLLRMLLMVEERNLLLFLTSAAVCFNHVLLLQCSVPDRIDHHKLTHT